MYFTVISHFAHLQDLVFNSYVFNFLDRIRRRNVQTELFNQRSKLKSIVKRAEIE